MELLRFGCEVGRVALNGVDPASGFEVNDVRWTSDKGTRPGIRSMKPPALGTWSVRSLRRHLQKRRFAIPKLQRNFVWDARRAAKLMDSIYKDMPIGSLFLWEMDRKSANLIQQSAEVLPAFNSSNRRIWFVIDGQQRLSVVHQAFAAQERKNDAGRDINFGRLCFVVRPDRNRAGEISDPDRIVYRKPVGSELVPIHEILAPDWKSAMPSKAKAFMGKVKACRDRLLNYPVPVVIVRSATLDEIGEVFIRVNSQGMRITSADRAIALMGKLDIRAMAQRLRQRLRDKKIIVLATIDPILMGLNLIRERPKPQGDPPKLDLMAKRLAKLVESDEAEKKRFEKLWDRYEKAFLLTVDHLHRRFPVRSESYLPSANMLATLSVFFFYHPRPPSRYQAAEIRKWFWATGLAQRYSGRGYHRNIASDANLFYSLARGAKVRFRLTSRLDPIVDIQAAEYASHSSRTRTFFCLLASRKPRYLEDGTELSLDKDVLAYANRRHRHHVFPQSQLRGYFSPRAYNSLCNICFLVAHDNDRIGSRLPRSYLSEYRADGRPRFRAVMKSHLIPVGDDSGVWERGVVRAFKKFRQQRLAMICDGFNKAAGVKLFKTS